MSAEQLTRMRELEARCPNGYDSHLSHAEYAEREQLRELWREENFERHCKNNINLRAAVDHRIVTQHPRSAGTPDHILKQRIDSLTDPEFIDGEHFERWAQRFEEGYA